MATLFVRNLRNQNPFDPSDLRKKSSSDLSRLICASSRNVRPDGQSTALQRTLGLLFLLIAGSDDLVCYLSGTMSR